MLCETCKDRNNCVEICPALEADLDQITDDTWTETPAIYYDDEAQELRVYEYGQEKPFFSDNEKRVLYLLASGNTRKEIAKEMNISEGYVRFLIWSLRQKRLKLDHM